jgi:predicted nucleotidyltransferase
MVQRSQKSRRYVQPYRYASPDIPLSAIRRFARQIADRFHPEKIILFGSYAYGTPHEESDVDLLVVMPAANEISQAIRIKQAFERPFALDLIVKTPRNLARELRDENWFLREVIDKGKVLYEA